MSKKKVFLSGSIEGISIEESSSWRKKSKEALTAVGFDVYDPTQVILDNKDYVFSPNEVLINNSHDLYFSDILLVNMDLPEVIKTDEAPFFTIGEMFLAHRARMPIVTFGNSFKNRKAYQAIVTKNLATLDEAINYIIRNFGHK